MRVISLLDQAHRRADSEDYAEAVALVRQAESLAPHWQAIPKLRKEMEDNAVKFDQLVGQELEVILAVQDAQRALDAQRYDEAVDKATAILLVQAANKDAIAILDQARQGKARLR
ncbi:MAG TPA: hypothetical protein VG477_04280, partial [Thermoanaerobaculia bacterium]|nr:hypothetical protein [Thermoanaerobaculia bacterium]